MFQVPGVRVGDQRNREGAAAKALVVDELALVFDAVGPLDDEGQRQAGFRLALGVAQQRGGEHGLAGAVDAALGVEEGVERARRVAAGDAAVGQVERRLGEAEEIVVVRRARRRARRATGRPCRATGRDRS